MKKILNEEQFKKWETNQNNRKGKMNRKKEKSTAKQ
jgi:hypothetical protein